MRNFIFLYSVASQHRESKNQSNYSRQGVLDCIKHIWNPSCCLPVVLNSLCELHNAYENGRKVLKTKRNVLCLLPYHYTTVPNFKSNEPCKCGHFNVSNPSLSLLLRMQRVCSASSWQNNCQVFLLNLKRIPKYGRNCNQPYNRVKPVIQVTW